jgi:hypothetical protein
MCFGLIEFYRQMPFALRRGNGTVPALQNGPATVGQLTLKGLNCQAADGWLTQSRSTAISMNAARRQAVLAARSTHTAAWVGITFRLLDDAENIG